MGFIHNIAIIDQDDASLVIGRSIGPENGYTLDVGFMADSLGSLVALLRGVDYDSQLEALLDEVDLTYAEAPDANEFASVINPLIAREIAVIPKEKIPGLASRWAEYEDELSEQKNRTPVEVLTLLVDHCARAASLNKRVVIHSYE